MAADRVIPLPDGEPLEQGRCPVGWTFAYQASIWTVKGVYLARTRSGERELWLILSEERDGDAV